MKGNIDVYFSHQPNSLKKYLLFICRFEFLLFSDIIIIKNYFTYKCYFINRWDTCAGEVLLKCFGGQNTDLNGKEYNYGSETSLGNENGNLASLDKNLHEKVIKIWNNKLKNQ